MQYPDHTSAEDDDEWPEWAVLDQDRRPTSKAWLTWASVLVLTLGPGVGYILARALR